MSNDILHMIRRDPVIGGVLLITERAHPVSNEAFRVKLGLLRGNFTTTMIQKRAVKD